MKKQPHSAANGGTVKNLRKLQMLGAVALLGLGIVGTGCKSAPELTADQAQKLIQAKYDQTPAAGAHVLVNEAALKQGATASLWNLAKKYPNPLWGDFKLTDAGKKAVKLPAGGETIEWRAAAANDPKYTILLDTVAANHLKVKDLKEVQSDGAGGKTVDFSEVVSLEGVPEAIQSIAHTPGNKLSTKRVASFSLDNGAWKLDAIH